MAASPEDTVAPAGEAAADQPGYQEISPPPAAAGRPTDTALCALVLAARGIPHRWRLDGDAAVEVPAEQLATARQELALFAAENRNWPPAPPVALPTPDNRYPSLIVITLLALFHLLLHGGFLPFGHQAGTWVIRGAANGGRILAGDWWRPLTALCLHADISHLLGNLLLGAPLAVRLCRDLGSGVGWFLILASGGLGNLFNALLQAPDHTSIGASTALFGTLGLLAGLAWMRTRRTRLAARLWPVAAALALLGLLGSGGGDGHVDVVAHLGGFYWGSLLGVVAGVTLESRGQPGQGLNRALGLLAAGLIGGAWWAALAPA